MILPVVFEQNTLSKTKHVLDRHGWLEK